VYGWERPTRARGEARGDSPIPGGDWDEPGPLWDEPGEPGSGLGDVSGRTLEGQTPPSNTSAAPILGDAEILAAEALLDKRLLALLLALGERPRQAGELARTLRVLVVKRVRVKKKVRVREPGGWGYREVEKEVEEDRLVPQPLPASTLYRLLARLRRAGLVEEYRGLDARRRYYRLTPQTSIRARPPPHTRGSPQGRKGRRPTLEQVRGHSPGARPATRTASPAARNTCIQEPRGETRNPTTPRGDPARLTMVNWLTPVNPDSSRDSY